MSCDVKEDALTNIYRRRSTFSQMTIQSSLKPQEMAATVSWLSNRQEVRAVSIDGLPQMKLLRTISSAS